MKARVALFLLLASSLLLQQCAKQTAPTGGPKDETPPTLLESTPRNEQLNFNGDKIVLTFDEFIQLNNPLEQIIITPSIQKKFEAQARKNKVTITLKQALEPHTTYNINFRDAIQDLNEKNPAQVKLALSTGNYIDSLSISGLVTELLTEKTVKNYTVALTQYSDTFNIFKHPALWITQTDKEGKFSLENLKAGNYLLYAFEDKNRNLLIESKSERYTFLSQPIKLDSIISNQQLKAYKLDAGNFKLIAARPTYTYFTIRLSKTPVNYNVTAEGKELFSTIDTEGQSIKIFNTLPRDSTLVKFSASDSLSNQIDTTLYVKFNTGQPKEKFTAKVEYTNLYEHINTLESRVLFSKPAKYIKTDSIYIQLDSAYKLPLKKEDINWNKEQTVLTIRKKLEQPTKPKPEPIKRDRAQSHQDTTSNQKGETRKGTRQLPKSIDGSEKPKDSKVLNTLTLAKESIISVEDDTLHSTPGTIKKIKQQDTGIIFTKVETKEKFILQLLTKDFKLVQEISNAHAHKFENIPPDTYILRLIIDRNNNGRWDGGNFTNKTKPEEIVFYKNSKGEALITIKANWEVGPLLISYP